MACPACYQFQQVAQAEVHVRPHRARATTTDRRESKQDGGRFQRKSTPMTIACDHAGINKFDENCLLAN